MLRCTPPASVKHDLYDIHSPFTGTSYGALTMRHVLRSTATLFAVSLAATTLSFASATASTGTAGSPTATRCHGPQYPTGECKVTFGKGRYHRGDHPHFVSDPAFKPGERVVGHLHCQDQFTRKRGPWDAGGKGRVRDSFHVPAKTPLGTCRFTLKGKTTGATASGTFKVVKG